MTKQEQLKIYKKALFHYIVSFMFPFLEHLLKTHDGFCIYFVGKQKTEICFLKELKNLKPEKTYNSVYWFRYGRKLPRIKLLIQAIKNCKK